MLCIFIVSSWWATYAFPVVLLVLVILRTLVVINENYGFPHYVRLIYSKLLLLSLSQRIVPKHPHVLRWGGTIVFTTYLTPRSRDSSVGIATR
jgi:hypothetical protein